MSTVRLVVRPGETEFDGQSRIQGSLNLPLTECGEQQVEQIIAELRLEQPFDVIYGAVKSRLPTFVKIPPRGNSRGCTMAFQAISTLWRFRRWREG